MRDDSTYKSYFRVTNIIFWEKQLNIYFMAARYHTATQGIVHVLLILYTSYRDTYLLAHYMFHTIWCNWLKEVGCFKLS